MKNIYLIKFKNEFFLDCIEATKKDAIDYVYECDADKEKSMYPITVWHVSGTRMKKVFELKYSLQKKKV